MVMNKSAARRHFEKKQRGEAINRVIDTLTPRTAFVGSILLSAVVYSTLLYVVVGL